MKHLLCASMMAAATALELEWPWTHCPPPVWSHNGIRKYDGNNVKQVLYSGNDFTIVF